MGIEGGDARLPFMVSNRGVALALALAVAVVAVFALVPGLDLAAAGFFYAGEGRFAAVTPAGETLRRLFSLAPFALLLGAGLLYTLRRSGPRVPAPTGRALLALALSLALGPGLLVNVALKDHWHRPRPVQVAEFGGTERFRPVGLPGGDCARNCSFVSGEGASSFWSVAPALMVAPPFRRPALAAALLYAAATGLLRMGFGGHFLSDTLLAALLTWLVVAAVWRAVLGFRSPRAGG
ncbi:phosphatase PAP2 family protein [Lichenibacterium dinghuense]|uniref:phosphatase PAP2 family protein n=1 Tax=Lichenibacterium dinghuense TaxID=2895977 RepID=UPI001F284E38|nr:phosphatase PAP2 family protein [Lichenibacterium sp. 6Y81]